MSVRCVVCNPFVCSWVTVGSVEETYKSNRFPTGLLLQLGRLWARSRIRLGLGFPVLARPATISETLVDLAVEIHVPIVEFFRLTADVAAREPRPHLSAANDYTEEFVVLSLS